MRSLRRDLVATGAVALAVVVYLLWWVGAALPGLGSARATGLAVLALGFVASASAVVPGFTGLVHGNRAYLAVTSLLGLAALVAGVVVLWSGSEVALALLVAVLVALWAIATTHHVLLARAEDVTPETSTAPARATERAR